MAVNSVDLLTSIPQPKSTWEKIFDWSFSVGRYIVVFVEAAVLVAFAARFAMDRVKNDLQKKVDDSVAQLKFYETTGDTKDVLLTYYSLKGGKTIIEDQSKYSVLFTDVLQLVGNDALIQNISVRDTKLRVRGVCADFEASKKVESAFRASEFLKNVNYDLATINDNSGAVKFTVDADISQARYFSNFISETAAEQ